MESNKEKSVNNEIKLDSIKDAIAAIKAGEVIIVVDDEDRENEGDFICAAEAVTPDMVNFMIKHGRGLVCAPISVQRCKDLGLQMMVDSNTSNYETAFTISVDLLENGCTTGISTYDRAMTLNALGDWNINPKSLARPGHIFPLKAVDGGVIERPGHTEAAVDLARLAGFNPAGALIEILNDDGTMARLPDLYVMAKELNLKIISIEDLVAYRKEHNV